MGYVEHIYVHIPFCRSKCPYCDFYSIPVGTGDESLFEEYTESLIGEFRQNLPYINYGGIKTIYIGGGSPMLIGPDNLERLVRDLSAYLCKDGEVSIELNPGHLENKDAPSVLKASGINRVSIGVQSSRENLLERIKRAYSKKVLLGNMEKIKKQGMSLSLDFMFALPGQQLADLRHEMDFIKQADAGHVSCYMFTPPVKEDWKDLPGDTVIAQMFDLLHSGMESLGYVHYEISNYAKPGMECRHNNAYWTRKAYLGLGAGAHGFFSDRKMRYWNVKDIKKYMEYENKMQDFEILDAAEERREEIMLGMRMLKKGVRLDIVNKSGLETVLNKKLVTIDHGQKTVVLSREGIPLLNAVIGSLD